MRFDVSKRAKRLFEYHEFRVLLTTCSLSLSQAKGLVRLFWLLNLNQKLVAHHQLFENLIAFFESEVFSDLKCIDDDYRFYPGKSTNYRWSNDLTNWISTLKVILSKKDELSLAIPKFMLVRSASGKRNPMDGYGMDRHPIAAALWSRHQTTLTYPPRPENSNEYRYFLLQAHLCLAHIRCRAKIKLRDYLRYDGINEHAPSSVKTGDISRVVRDCYEDSHSGIVKDLSVLLPPDAFLGGMTFAELSRESVGILAPVDANDKFIRIVRFFKGVRKELFGHRKKRTVTTRSHTGRTAYEAAYHPGCDPISDSIWLHTPVVDDDPEYPSDPGVEVLQIDNEASAIEDESDDERVDSGLSPKPKPVPVLKLYFPEEIGGGLRQARLQYLAAEMHSQALASAYEYLSDTEHFYIEQKLQAEISVYLTGKVANTNQAQVALILKLIRHFGITPDQARNIQIIDVTKVESPDRIALLVDNTNQSPSFRWSLPGLQPKYLKGHEWDEALNRDRADRLTLPDFAGLGPEIIAFMERSGRQPAHPFSLEEKTFTRLAKELLESVGGDRLTIAKLRRTVTARILYRHRDPVIIWLLTADQRKIGEPRLYYARYPVAVLQEIYRKVSIGVLRAIGKRYSGPPVPYDPAIWNSPSVGCRYVLSIDAVTRLVRTVKKQVQASLPDNAGQNEVIAYHNAYALHLCLKQALLTSYRAVNDPTDLIDWFIETNGNFPIATLSDKDNIAQESARLCVLTQALRDQFSNWIAHAKAVDAILEMRECFDGNRSTLFYLDDSARPIGITRSWLEAQYAHFGFKIPANFHRSFLRNTLIQLRCPAEFVDAFLGHASMGQSPFSDRSTFSYRDYRIEITKALESLAKSVGLQPLKSRLAK